MKKIVVSSALSALLVLPAMAFEVYNNDDTKVDVYGSIRGYVGYGESGKAGADAGYLIGIQNNSQFGVKFQKDKFKANVEWGAVEAGVDGQASSTGWRQYWGSYTTSAGTILFGKTNTPTIDNGFTNDFFNNDNGSQGFGGVATGSRKIQIQYNVAGLSLALVEDYTGNGRSGQAQPNQESPRIAASYSINDEKGKPTFKIAATYKYYNADSIAGFNTDTQGNITTPKVPAGTSAYHAWLGVKQSFGSMFVSAMAHYGKNGNLYGEQSTTFSYGGYAHSKALDGAVGFDAQRAGARVEFGSKLSDDMSVIVGAGYQATFGGKGQKNAVTVDGGETKNSIIHGYSAFIQLPYKVSSNFTFAPQVSFYQTIEGTKGVGSVAGLESRKETGVIAAARIKWDF